MIGTALLILLGSYTFTTTNSFGCDSTATLNLTINSATSSTSDITACDSYDWNGTTYTTSGSYTFTTTNSSGCDSTATLNLTINNSPYVNVVSSNSNHLFRRFFSDYFISKYGYLQLVSCWTIVIYCF